MKQTAVEFIEDYLKFKGIIIDDKTTPQVLVGIINQAKEMEKQQIIDTCKYGNNFEQGDLNCENYYNKTYKNNEIDEKNWIREQWIIDYQNKKNNETNSSRVVG
jgi:hypothetical protein